MKARPLALVMASALIVTIMSLPSSASVPDGAQSPALGPDSATAQLKAEQKGLQKERRKPRWKPTVGAKFNNPFIDGPPRFNIEQDVIKAIRATPKGEKIRISVYSFDRRDVATALLAARRRGVKVQILLNDHQLTTEQKMLKRALGRNPNKSNFSYECHAACRGRRDNLHSKFFLFTRTGGVDDVIMVGSANFTLNSAKWQWNDMLTLVRKEKLFQDYVKLFDDMRKDYSRNRPYYTFCGKDPGQPCNDASVNQFNRVFPRKSPKTDDVVMTEILGPIRCVSQGKRTMLRLSMHTMQGARGIWIADRLRSLWARGCNIRVIYGLMGARVKGHLGLPTSRGRIPLRSTGFDYDGDGEVNRYTHQKYFVVRGWSVGGWVNKVYTGSSNWSSRGTYGDEIISSIRGPKFVNQYLRNFGLMWNSSRYSRNAYTTTSGPTVVEPVLRRTSDGRTYTTYVTKQKVVTVNRPDGLRPGPTWEAD